MRVEFRRVALPAFGIPEEMPSIPGEEYEARVRALQAATGTDWVVVYGDREHAANLTFFSGFDPRFEEGMLILGPGEKRVLVVGNEGVIHVQVAGLRAEVVLYQPFSLMAQPRGDSPPLAELLIPLADAQLVPRTRLEPWVLVSLVLFALLVTI